MSVAIMKFYNRENELQILRDMAIKSHQTAQMTFIVGRRRIGKTKLVLEAYPDRVVYFFVSKKSENLLCHEYKQQIQSSLNINIHGEFIQFAHLLNICLKSQKPNNSL